VGESYTEQEGGEKSGCGSHGFVKGWLGAAVRSSYTTTEKEKAAGIPAAL
jgi:hypothetical protein